jgi:hypothetical protein
MRLSGLGPLRYFEPMSSYLAPSGRCITSQHRKLKASCQPDRERREQDQNHELGGAGQRVAKKAFAGLPFPPLREVDTDAPINFSHIQAALDAAPARPGGQQATSVVVRSKIGNPKRGGYFFHIARAPSSPQQFEVYDFEKRLIEVFDAASLVRFINHCAGLLFDEEMLKLCQMKINFKVDGQEADA